MNKIQMAAKTTWKFIDKNLPHILTAMSLTGLVSSVIAAAKEGPRAQEALNSAKMDKAEAIELNGESLDIYRDDAGELSLTKVKLTPWESFKALAPIYWPCALTTAATSVCIISTDIVHTKRYAAVLAALTMNEKHLKEYQDKVKELFGEKKESQVKREIAKDRASECPPELESGYLVGQQYPCYLSGTGLYWISSRQKIESAFNRWNQDGLRQGGDVWMEDLIYELGIDEAVKDTFMYRHMSWDLNNGIVEPVIETGETTNGIPCLCVRTSRVPDNWA